MTGQEVQKIRAELNLTQRQLATFLDVTTKTVSTWENGRLKRPFPRTAALAFEFLRLARRYKPARTKLEEMLSATV
jgi:DNA-binding transcriptional regulator YiaG